MIAALLLAAGSARRFGAPKLLQDVGGKPIVRWSAEAVVHPLVGEIIVVVPPEHEEIRRALAGMAVRFVVNPEPDGGMASSIACGIRARGTQTEAVLVALADEPLMSRAALERVVARYRESGVSIIAPTYEGIRGHPVLFARSVFGELEVLSGDQGARAVTDRDPGRVAIIEMAMRKPIDVDTAADLALLRASIGLGGVGDLGDVGDTLLNELMPGYDVRASYGMDVHASPEIVYRAVLETNLADSVLAKVLMVMRSLGRRQTGQKSFRFGDLPSRGSFFLLGQDPPREIVAGVVGKFWALRSNVGDGDRESFRAPPAPGTAKAAWNFRVDRTTSGTRLTTETRVLCADDESRRAFRRYWSVIGPFSGVIRMEALRLIRKQAHFIASNNTRLP